MSIVYRAMLGCYTALALTVIAWVWDADIGRWIVKAGWTVVALIPLSLPLGGLTRRDRRTYAWATLCAIPYIVVALTESVAAPERRLWAAVCLAASFAWFISLIAVLRASRPSLEDARDEGSAEPPLRGE